MTKRLRKGRRTRSDAARDQYQLTDQGRADLAAYQMTGVLPAGLSVGAMAALVALADAEAGQL